MRRINKPHKYPDNWQEISRKVKDRAEWCCIRCGHPHNPATGYTLTVHHLDLNPSNNAWWNLAALCQRCHLHIQGKVIIEQIWMFDHSEWIKPYIAGLYAFRAGLPDDRAFVLAHLEWILRIISDNGANL